MQETQPPGRSFLHQSRGNRGGSDRSTHNGHLPRPAPAQFDLIVTFASDEVARRALFGLRDAGFGPDEAVLLTPGPLAADEFELAVDELRSESWLAFGIVIASELVMGVLAGAVIGWLIGLFRNAPQVGPIWQPILIFGCVGFLAALIAGLFERRRWRRVHLPSSGEAAIALRLRGPAAARQLTLAQSVLEQFGGQRETG